MVTLENSNDSVKVKIGIYDFLNLIDFVYLVVYSYMDIWIILQICDRKIEKNESEVQSGPFLKVILILKSIVVGFF